MNPIERLGTAVRRLLTWLVGSLVGWFIDLPERCMITFICLSSCQSLVRRFFRTAPLSPTSSFSAAAQFLYFFFATFLLFHFGAVSHSFFICKFSFVLPVPRCSSVVKSGLSALLHFAVPTPILYFFHCNSWQWSSALLGIGIVSRHQLMVH